jgi:WXXGXW repeat (2 copies)
LNKSFLTALFGVALAISSAQAAELVIKLRPPIAIKEHRTVAPSRKHVWIGGYHKWDGNAYAWQPGRWEVPPREHAVWVAPRYTHQRDGYTFTEGRWR